MSHRTSRQGRRPARCDSWALPAARLSPTNNKQQQHIGKAPAHNHRHQNTKCEGHRFCFFLTFTLTHRHTHTQLLYYSYECGINRIIPLKLFIVLWDEIRTASGLRVKLKHAAVSPSSGDKGTHARERSGGCADEHRHLYMLRSHSSTIWCHICVWTESELSRLLTFVEKTKSFVGNCLQWCKCVPLLLIRMNRLNTMLTFTIPSK